jgi:hypothetical protein
MHACHASLPLVPFTVEAYMYENRIQVAESYTHFLLTHDIINIADAFNFVQYITSVDRDTYTWLFTITD